MAAILKLRHVPTCAAEHWRCPRVASYDARKALEMGAEAATWLRHGQMKQTISMA